MALNIFFIIFIIILILFILYYNIRSYLNVWRYTEKLPGPRTIPIFGNILQVGYTLEDYLNTLLKWWNIYGCDKYRAWALNQPYIFISHPKDIETVLTSTTLLEKGDIYDFLRPWLGDGLLNSTGSKWYKHRKMITPSFHFKILNNFLEYMNNCGDVFISKLRWYANYDKIIDIQKLTSNYTLDVICESAFGISMESTENFNSDVVSAAYKLCEIIPQRIFSGLKRFDFIYKWTTEYREQEHALKILRNFIFKIIEKRRKIIDQYQEDLNKMNNNENSELNIKQKKAFLDNLLTAEIDGRPLTFDEIFEEVSTFMFEGYDTTKSATMFALYILSRYPDIQKKAFEEQQKIFSDNLKRTATYKELQEMHYLELIIKETLRIFPSVPLIARYTRDKFILDDNTIIPPNTTIILFLFAMGRNDKYFKEPYKIDPERFNSQNRENDNPFDYVPFSAGPRNCIGQKFAMLELKTILSKFLRNYELLPPYKNCCENYYESHHHNVLDKNLDPPILSIAITLKSKNGIKLRLKYRKN